jgi:hypothetical protein
MNGWAMLLERGMLYVSHTKNTNRYVGNKKHANELKIANGLREFWKLQGKRK